MLENKGFLEGRNNHCAWNWGGRQFFAGIVGVFDNDMSGRSANNRGGAALNDLLVIIGVLRRGITGAITGGYLQPSQLMHSVPNFTFRVKPSFCATCSPPWFIVNWKSEMCQNLRMLHAGFVRESARLKEHKETETTEKQVSVSLVFYVLNCSATCFLLVQAFGVPHDEIGQRFKYTSARIPQRPLIRQLHDTCSVRHYGMCDRIAQKKNARYFCLTCKVATMEKVNDPKAGPTFRHRGS